mgnify:CR=1
MASAGALAINQGIIIYSFAFVALCGALQTLFHGWGRSGEQQVHSKPPFYRYSPSCEKAILENPQIFQNCELKNIFSAENG